MTTTKADAVAEALSTPQIGALLGSKLQPDHRCRVFSVYPDGNFLVEGLKPHEGIWLVYGEKWHEIYEVVL